MRETVINKTLECKIIAIVRGIDCKKCLNTAKALYDGGIEMVEVTFNQSKPETFSETAEAIKTVRPFADGDRGGAFRGGGFYKDIPRVELRAGIHKGCARPAQPCPPSGRRRDKLGQHSGVSCRRRSRRGSRRQSRQ